MQEGFWGFSAGDAPNKQYLVYNALDYSSGVCLACVPGSAMYLKDEILDDVSAWLASPYGKQIWGRYGLTDSIDLDQNWIGQVVFGITVGPEFLSLANTDEKTSVWKVFMTLPEIQRGLKAAESADKL